MCNVFFHKTVLPIIHVGKGHTVQPVKNVCEEKRLGKVFAW